METVRILLVDDQGIILDGLEALIAQNPRFQVCGRANDGQAALEQAKALRPDVVLMDVSMPGMDGIEATRRVKKEVKGTEVLVLTMYNNEEFIRELMDVGAAGYLLKNTSRQELWEAIEAVSCGRRYLAKQAQETLDARYAVLKENGEMGGCNHLTRREKEIVRLIVAEKTTLEIANALFLSPATIETHRKNILHKLGMHSTAGIVRYAMERGWHAYP